MIVQFPPIMSLDIISALEGHNLSLIIRQIFRPLSTKDILSCLCVSRSWRRIVHQNAVRTNYKEVEAMWGYGKLKATKLDYLDRLEGHEALKGLPLPVKVLSDSGHVVILPQVPQWAKDRDQLMFVYRGSEFVAKVTVPLYEAKREGFVQLWEWKFEEVALMEDGQLMLVGVTERQCKECSK